MSPMMYRRGSRGAERLSINMLQCELLLNCQHEARFSNHLTHLGVVYYYIRNHLVTNLFSNTQLFSGASQNICENLNHREREYREKRLRSFVFYLAEPEPLETRLFISCWRGFSPSSLGDVYVLNKV